MKRLSIFIAASLALSVFAANSTPKPPSHSAANSKADHKKEATKKSDDKPDKNHGQDDRGKDKDDQHDPKDCHDPRHDHGKPPHPKPPKPPKPPHDHTQPLPAPTGLSAEAVSLFQVNLTWTDNSTNELGFKIERSLDGTNFVQIAQVLPNTTVYCDLNRFPDTKYFYRARAFNAKGDSAYANLARTQTPAPDCALSLVSFGFFSAALETNHNEIVAISRSPYGGLLLHRNGAISGWGLDAAGRPMAAVPALTNAVAIAAGDQHHLALLGNGTVVSWGINHQGQTTVPPELQNVTAIAAGYQHSLALQADGTVVGWGDNQYGQSNPPTNLTGVVAIAAGAEFSVALKSDGTVVQWGALYVPNFKPPAGLSNVTAIAAGATHVLALKRDGTVVQWTYPDYFFPQPDGLTNVTAIAAGRSISIALWADATAQAWSDQIFLQNYLAETTNFTGVVAIAGSDFSGTLLTTLPSDNLWVTPRVIATNEVLLSWISPSADVSAFQVERATNGNGVSVFPGVWTPIWEQIGVVDGSVTYFSDHNVVSGGQYSYRVHAVNQCGRGPYGWETFAAVIAPEASPFLSVSQVGNAATLYFYWNSFGTYGAIGHRIERALDNDGEPGTWTEIATILDADPNNPTYTDPGLSLDTTYWYRVRTFNGLGTSPYSAPVSLKITLPTAPINLRAWIGNPQQVELSWYANQLPSTLESHLERANDAGGQPGAWTEIASLTSPYYYELRYTDSGITANQTNWYRVRSVNQLGSSPYTQPLQVVVTPPSTPTLAGWAFSTTAKLQWYHDYAGKVSQFQLERAAEVNGQPGNWAALATINNPSAPIFQASSGMYADQNLTPASAYWYRLRGSNWAGLSPFSAPLRVEIMPPQPPYFYATMGFSNRVDIFLYGSWLGDQDGFKLERALDANGTPGAWTEVATIASPGPLEIRYSDTNVTALATYWYRARSFNAAGISDYTQPGSVSLVPPSSPSDLSAGTFADEANLLWSAGNFPSGLLEGFKIERAPDLAGVPGAWEQIATGTEASFRENYYYTYSYRDPGLTLNQAYWYRLRAYNWAGDSAYCAPVSVRISPPATPIGLTARIGDTNQVQVYWYAAAPGDQEGFLLEHATDAGDAPGAWQPLATLNLRSNYTAAEFIHTNIPPHTTQWYRVRAFNFLGQSEYSLPAKVETVPPEAPGNLSASSFADQVKLYWDYNYYGPTVGNYEIERASDTNGIPGNWTAIGSAPSFYPAYTDIGRSADTTYWYRVRAVNWIGASPFSEPASVTVTGPRTPQGLVAFIGGTNTVTFELRASSPYDQDGFYLERAPDLGNQPGIWQELAVVGATNAYSASAADTNAVANSIYWYRIRAFNRTGVSAATAGTQVRIAPPPAPQLDAQTYATTVRLNYYGYYESSYGKVRGFKIERAADASGQPGIWEQIAKSADGLTYGALNDSNRVANATYWYRTRAYNWIGDGTYSAARKVTILPPPTPYIYNALIGTSNQITFTIDLYFPSDQEGYKIERAPDVGGMPMNWTEIATVPAADVNYSQFTDTQVIANTTNWYRARSFNAVGHSDYCQPLPVPVLPPPAPAGLQAQPYTDKVYLSWYNGYYSWYGKVDELHLERATDANGLPGAWARIATLTNLVDNFTDSGFSAGTKIWYRLRARNWVGTSPYTEPVSATITPPAAPTIGYAKIGTTNQVTAYLYANYPLDQDGFIIERAADTNGSAGPWQEILTLLATNVWSAGFADTNVSANTTNWYRARAFNKLGASSNSLPVAIAAIPPPPPYSLSATPFADQMRASWYNDLIQYGDVSGISIERAGDVGGSPDNWTPIGVFTNITSTWWQYVSFIDSNLTVNTTYWYRLRSYNWIGQGPPSDPVSATIVPPASPQYLVATVGTSNKVELRWQPSTANDQQGFIVERADDVAGGPANWARIATNRPPVPPNSYYNIYHTDTNVIAGAKYWYQVRSFNVLGTSEPSAAASIQLVPPPGLYQLSAQPFANQVTLSWSSYNIGTYGHVNGYRIQRAPDNGGSPGTWMEIATVAGVQNTSYVDRNLPAQSSKYWYRVQAWNWLGAGNFSPLASATIRLPSAPVWSRGTVGATNQLNLSWYFQSPYDQAGLIIESAPDIGGVPATWSEVATISASGSYSIDFTDTNAIANTTNWYRARTFNVVGISSNSLPEAVRITAPPAPDNLSVSAYANRADLSWYGWNYAYGELGSFTVERAPDLGGIPGSWTQITNVLPTYYSYSYYSDQNLSPGASYWYRVHSHNWVGAGTNTLPVKVTITKPVAPLFLTAKVGATNQIELSWSPGSPNDADLYFVERAADTGGIPGSWTALGTVTNYSSYPSFTDTNGVAFTTNWYRVRAFNVVGYSDYSEPLNFRIVPPPTATSVTLNRYANRVSVEWYNNSVYYYGQISGFKVERASDNSGIPGNWTQIADVTSNYGWSGYYTDSNLVAGASYWYRVRLWNWVGNGTYSEPFKTTILPPVAPTSIYASTNGSNQINLWWYAAYPNDQEGFKVERSTVAQNVWTQIATVPATNYSYGSYTDTNFVPNVTNYYRVRAFNVVGDSLYSATVGALITLPSAALVPAVLRIESLTITNHDVLITWTGTGGMTNVVEAASRLEENFTPISPNLKLDGTGNVTTNFLDGGALTNSTSRFYRIRVVR